MVGGLGCRSRDGAPRPGPPVASVPVLDLQVQLAAGAAALAVMLAAWVASLVLRDASVADIAWGPVFVAIAWTVWAVGPGAGGRSLLLAALLTAWGVRLAAHILNRHRGEDPRYRAMRARAGARFWWRSLFTVFLLQAAIAWVVSLPVQVAATDPTPGTLGALDLAGAALMLAGLGVETIADLQLSRFRADPAKRGAVLDSGLWRYSRHPNYFGDSVVWWGVYVVALSTGSAWWSAVGPALMTFLLLRVSGVALTERTITERRPAYRDYIERTSAFVPLPPRR